MPDEFWKLDRDLVRRLPRTWPAFFQQFGRFTPVQREAIPPILAGRSVLITAATAAGKTEAACAPLVESRLEESEPWFILYVAPTRALVNDIRQRLMRPLELLGVRTLRRTGDHKEALERRSSVLVTTPESFESMLCRREDWFDRGRIHPLALVSGVVLDEIHLLQSNPRGAQLRLLLERLRRLRDQGRRKGWVRSDRLQIVALSATVAAPTRTLQRFVGDGDLISVAGSRELEIVAPESRLPATEEAVGDYIAGLGNTDEKILVFANSRRRVDDLASYFKKELERFRYEVHAHHGSLGLSFRESAEKAAREQRRVLLVATSTLELGIDIGDIDLVVLDGPAPDVSALLQRVGRGGRRSNKTRLMLCASSGSEVLLNSAMVHCARDGDLGPPFDGPNFSVLVQQVACFILQGEKRDKPREKVVCFLELELDRAAAVSLLDHLIAGGLLIQDHGRVRLGQDFLDQAAQGALYSNIESVYGSSVIDDVSGGMIATGVQYRGGSALNLGGHTLQVKGWSENRVLVKRLSQDRVGDAEWSYTSKAWARGPSQPHALRRYLGIPAKEWPVVVTPKESLIFHLGGARRQAVLDLAARQQHKAVQVNEWLLRLSGPFHRRPDWVSETRDSALDLQIGNHLERLERELARPHANRQLPLELRIREVREWLKVPEEVDALRASRWTLCVDPELRDVLLWFAKAVSEERPSSQEELLAEGFWF